VDITDNSYAPADLVRLEAILLTSLSYQLAVPTPLHFLHHLLAHAQLEAGGSSSPVSPCCPTEARLVHLAEYALELCLLSPHALRWRPSVLAASALGLAADILRPPGRHAHARLCGSVSAAAGGGLDDCKAEAARMLQWATSTAQPPAVTEKFSEARYSFVGWLQLQPRHA
jgi:hypothetical protein